MPLLLTAAYCVTCAIFVFLEITGVLTVFSFFLISVIPQTPTLTVAPSHATIESGTSVTVTCTTTSTGGSVTYDFMRDGNVVTSQPSGTYTMGSIATSESGTYTCTATISTVTSVVSSGHSTTVVGESIVYDDLLYYLCNCTFNFKYK